MRLYGPGKFNQPTWIVSNRIADVVGVLFIISIPNRHSFHHQEGHDTCYPKSDFILGAIGQLALYGKFNKIVKDKVASSCLPSHKVLGSLMSSPSTCPSIFSRQKIDF